MIAPLNPNRKSSPADQRPQPATDAGPSMKVHKFVWGFGVFMVLVAGGGFGFKLYEFISTFGSGGPLQFAIFPVVTYLLVAAGFGCLFIWAYLRGQFKNVEAAKYRMLEMQKEFDDVK